MKSKRTIVVFFVFFLLLIFSAIMYRHPDNSSIFISLFNDYCDDTRSNVVSEIWSNPQFKKDGLFRDLDAPTSVSQNIPENFINGLAKQIFFPKHLDPKQENFTLIIQTYRRMQVLPKLLMHYCQLEALHKILLLWNDVTSPVPKILQKLSCRVSLKILQMKANRMTNRFVLRPEIETDG